MIKFKNICPNLKNLFFSSDFHFFHRNLTKGVSTWDDVSKCRNFNTVEEMNEIIIDGINKYVGENDVLVHCGDFSFNGSDKIKLSRDRINCKTIYGIAGNHDIEANNYLYSEVFKEYSQLGYFKCEGVEFLCSHYSLWNWHSCGKGVINLHGHQHGDENEISKLIHKYNSLDVGIDNAYKLFGEYRVFNALEIIEIMKQKNIKLENHHNQ